MFRRVLRQKFADISEVLTASIIRATMEAASTSGTSLNIYQTTRRNIPEDSHLHNRRRENLNSYHVPTYWICFHSSFETDKSVDGYPIKRRYKSEYVSEN
jgi:hypothetical protein